MQIRYYIHVWQGLLMFIAGLIGVVAAFAGYIHSGGGEEILRRALARMDTGAVRFDALKVDWLGGEMTAYGVEKQNGLTLGKGDAVAVLEGLRSENLRVKLDLYPWPPEVTKVTVSGMEKVSIKVSDGFLQFGDIPRRAQDAPALPPIAFENCNLNLTVGGLSPIELTGCSGELRVGTGNSLRGIFSLRQLNGRPFNFKLETLEDGRWVFAGEEIQLDTRQTLKGKNPLAGKIDPVQALVAALFSGQMGATGTVKFLRVVVQPSTPTTKFVCDGEVGFANLEFQLPPLEEKAGQVLPEMLARLLGMDEGSGPNLWPRWMQVERIRTGPNGRVSFHMADGKLNITADEGPGSALIGIRGNQTLPALESLKGVVETDSKGNAERIILRGFLGSDLSFDTRVQRAEDGSRTYGLVLQPRTGDYMDVAFNRPLWRFASRVQDYLNVESMPPKDEGGEKGERSLVDFEIEGETRHFPLPELLLPGLRDVSGRIYTKGKFTNKSRLRIDDLRFDSGSIVYGGAAKAEGAQAGDFGPLWHTLQNLFDAPLPWSLQDVTLRGKVVAQFGLDLTWESTEFKDIELTTGQLAHAGLISNLGVAGMTLSAKHVRTPKNSTVDLRAEVKDRWLVRLLGEWPFGAGDANSGKFTLTEKDVPFNLHPQREQLAPQYVSEDKRRVNRTTTIVIENGKAERQP